MAVDMFLKLDGIKGESKQTGHKDEIDIYSWSWGLTQSGSWSMGGGGGSGKVNVSDLSVSKKLDSSTAKITATACKGDHIATGVLTCRKAGGTQLEYLKIELTDIIVTGIQTSGAGMGDEVMETLSLNFGQFKCTYKEQDEKGQGTNPQVYGYNVKEGKPL